MTYRCQEAANTGFKAHRRIFTTRPRMLLPSNACFNVSISYSRHPRAQISLQNDRNNHRTVRKEHSRGTSFDRRVALGKSLGRDNTVYLDIRKIIDTSQLMYRHTNASLRELASVVQDLGNTEVPHPNHSGATRAVKVQMAQGGTHFREVRKMFWACSR